MNLYEQQAANRKATWYIVAAFVALFVFIGLGADVFLFGYPVPGLPQQPAVFGPNRRTISAATQRYSASGLYNNRYSSGGDYHQVPPSVPASPFPFATTIALLVAGVFMANAYFRGVGMVLRSTGAYQANPNMLPSHRQLMNVVTEMSIASGQPMPRVFVIPDPDPNAFATGFSDKDACVAVTEGLLNTLDRNELQAVIAHEMSHIHNLDIRLMTAVSALGGALVLLSDYARRVMFSGRNRNNRSSNSGGGGQLMIILFVIWIILLIIAPIMVRLMSMAISRRREFLADATAAEFTRDPLSLVSALKKIRASASPTRSVGQGVAHMCIEDPRGASFSDGTSFLSDLFSTHPPMPQRIAALEEMAMKNGGDRTDSK